MKGMVDKAMDKAAYDILMGKSTVTDFAPEGVDATAWAKERKATRKAEAAGYPESVLSAMTALSALISLDD